MEKILKTGLVKDNKYNYYIDKDGDVARSLKRKGSKSEIKKIAKEQFNEMLEQTKIKGDLKKKMQSDFKEALGEL